MFKSFYLSDLTPVLSSRLTKGRSFSLTWVTINKSCPTLAKSSGYLGIGGQAASHLCPLTNLVNQVNSTLMTMQL